MSTHDLLRDRLIELKKRDFALGKAPVQEIKNEWLGRLARLMRDLRDWLAKDIAAGDFKCQIGKALCTEEQLGAYLAPTLKIEGPGNRRVLVQAVARFVVGSQGRVDITHGEKRAVLVYFQPSQGELPEDVDPSRWYLVTLPPVSAQPKYEELNRDTFRDALSEILA